jgi:hypothetical protein
MTYIKLSSEPNDDGSDQYTGLGPSENRDGHRALGERQRISEKRGAGIINMYPFSVPFFRFLLLDEYLL